MEIKREKRFLSKNSNGFISLCSKKLLNLHASISSKLFSKLVSFLKRVFCAQSFVNKSLSFSVPWQWLQSKELESFNSRLKPNIKLKSSLMRSVKQLSIHCKMLWRANYLILPRKTVHLLRLVRARCEINEKHAAVVVWKQRNLNCFVVREDKFHTKLKNIKSYITVSERWNERDNRSGMN